MAPGTQRVLRERLLSDLATLPRTRHVAQDKFLQLIETQFPQLQRGRNLLPSVAERIPEQLRKTWKDSEHHTGSPTYSFLEKITVSPVRRHFHCSDQRPALTQSLVSLPSQHTFHFPGPHLTPPHGQATSRAPEEGRTAPGRQAQLYHGEVWAWESRRPRIWANHELLGLRVTFPIKPGHAASW